MQRTEEAYSRACLLNRGDWVVYVPVEGSSSTNPNLAEHAGGRFRVLSTGGSYVLVDDPSRPEVVPFEVYRPHLSYRHSDKGEGA